MKLMVNGVEREATPKEEAAIVASSFIVPTKTADEIDTETLNVALAAPGSVVRALALLMLQEVNKLRVKDGDAAYTLAQFTAALKAKMRNGA